MATQFSASQHPWPVAFDSSTNRGEFARSRGRQSHSLDHGLGLQAGSTRKPRHKFKAHMERVGAMAEQLARDLGLAREEARLIGVAAGLHDIGKLFVDPALLDKPGPLTTEELKVVQSHSSWGHAVLARNHNVESQLAARVALQHHENWDGSGYPAGLSGRSICRAARITAICDMYDALREQRAYKPAYSHHEAVLEIVREAKAKFDPEMLEMFLSRHHVYDEIFQGHQTETRGNSQHPSSRAASFLQADQLDWPASVS